MKLEIKLKDIFVSILFLVILILNFIKWYWVWFVIGLLAFVIYAVLRLYEKDNNPLDNIQARSIGGEIPPDDDENGGTP